MPAKKTLIAGIAVAAVALGVGGVALAVAPANADQPASPAAAAAPAAPVAAAVPANNPVAPAAAAPRQGQARGSTIVAYDPAALQALAPLSPSAIRPGSLSLTSDVEAISAFPVIGNQNNGLIRHAGGLTFTNGPRTVTLLNYVIDPAKGVLTATTFVDGKPFGSVPFLTLAPAAAQNGCTTTATLKLAPAAAFAFSDAFGVADLTGATIGTACVTLR
jgi:hypothetical protein